MILQKLRRDAEDFLGSAAGREPREQQREEEPSQKNGPE